MQKNKFHDISVLFVEDDQEVRENTAYMLDNYFKEVHTAQEGMEALDLFYKHHHDIIITDVKMTGMDGVELVHTIREYDKNIPIIIMTAYSDEDTLLQVVSSHLFEYIVKPVTYTKLMDVLSKCIDTHTTIKNRDFAIDTNIRYSFSKKVLFKNNQTINLTHQEIEFLELLIKNKGEVVSYDMIEYEVWKDRVMSRDAIKTLVKKLRNKLSNDIINTVVGYGYRLS
jgi:DNA-binding response OmpR family regulator